METGIIIEKQQLWQSFKELQLEEKIYKTLVFLHVRVLPASVFSQHEISFKE